jgi:hypothetical protein
MTGTDVRDARCLENWLIGLADAIAHDRTADSRCLEDGRVAAWQAVGVATPLGQGSQQNESCYNRPAVGGGRRRMWTFDARLTVGRVQERGRATNAMSSPPIARTSSSDA